MDLPAGKKNSEESKSQRSGRQGTSSRTITFRIQNRESIRSLQFVSASERERESTEGRRSSYSDEDGDEDDDDGDGGGYSVNGIRTRLSNLSRGIALSPRGAPSKSNRNAANNNLSTSRFLCATIVNRPHSTDDNVTVPPHQMRPTISTMISRSVILSATAQLVHRRSSSRNVKILDLPVNKRLSVPWDDLYQAEGTPDARGANTPSVDSEQEKGRFLRRTNSDVIWGEPILSGLKLPIPKLGEKLQEEGINRPGAVLLPSLTSIRRLPSKMDMNLNSSSYSVRSASSTSHAPTNFFGSKTIRRQPIVPALDQMALDLRAGWMGEDDIEPELEGLLLYDAKENTKINRSGEINSIFEIGQCVVATEDIDYYCGIVPAGSMGTIIRISQWRLFVTWHLRNFEKLGEFEVCAYEVSKDVNNYESQASVTRSRPTPAAFRYKGDYATEDNSRHIDFDMDITEWIEPSPKIRNTNFSQSTKNSADMNAGLFSNAGARL